MHYRATTLGIALCLGNLLHSAAKAEGVAAPAAQVSAFPELKVEQEKLILENAIFEQKLRKELAARAAEKQKLDLENSLRQEKLQAEAAGLQAQVDELTRQIALLDKQQELAAKQRRASLDKELADSREKVERLKAENELAMAELAAKSRSVQQKDMELQIRQKEILVQRSEVDLQVARLNSEIDLWEKREDWRNRVPREIEYTKEPFKDGVLTISDRRIALNGPIMMDTADYISERIDYFNNQSSEWPIFIVIDSSPGGSVMAGYKILKAMEGSPAPVYVVLKSFAASMAAGIATLAKKSFAYPNAIILHHQMLAANVGNLTQQRERMKEMEEWWSRLATPVAKKMGISLEEFVKKMYSSTITGDWREFGDRAMSIKWIDQTVDTIREQSLVKNPDRDGENRLRVAAFPALKETVDPEGRHYVELPRLQPFDAYYLFNPDGYYRVGR